MGGHTFRFRLVKMQMGRQGVQKEEESHAQQKSESSRDPCCLPFFRSHIYGRDQQRPHGCRHHHSRGKSQQEFLKPHIHFFFHKKNHSRAQGGPGKWYQYSQQCILIHKSSSKTILPIFITVLSYASEEAFVNIYNAGKICFFLYFWLKSNFPNALPD